MDGRGGREMERSAQTQGQWRALRLCDVPIDKGLNGSFGLDRSWIGEVMKKGNKKLITN